MISRLASVSVALAIVLCVPRVGVAQPQQAVSVPRVAPLVPTLQISGSTSSTTDLRVGFDYVRGLSDYWDMAITPVFATQTKNGATSLFTLKNAAIGVANPWFIGLSLSFIDLSPELDPNAPGAPASVRDAQAFAKSEAFNQCNLACRYDSPSRSDEECKAFDAWEQERKNFEPEIAECAKSCEEKSCAKPDSDNCRACAERCRGLVPDFAIKFSPDQMCKSGNALFRRKYDGLRRERRGRFPEWILSVGAAWGLSEHQYLDAVPTATMGDLAVVDKTKSDIRVAASATYVSTTSPLTVEWAAYLRSVFDDSLTTAQWCTPMVPVQDLKGGTAQTCKQLPQGAPENGQTLWTTILVGYVDKPDGPWRMAIGPVVSFDASSSSGAIGAQAPFYLDLASVPGFAGDFKFIVRITPAASYGVWGSTQVRQVGVTVELLTQRNLFPRALDWVR